MAVDAHRLMTDFRDLGFDAILGFSPQLSVFGAVLLRPARTVEAESERPAGGS